jgi:hypothetical protein
VATRTTTKRATKRTVKKVEEPQLVTDVKETVNSYTPSSFSSLSQKNKNFIIFLSIVLLALISIFFLKRNWLLAAQVNNSYVTNLEVQDRLNKQYKKAVLDELVDEKIIQNEANNKGVNVTEQEINTKLTEYETQFGGPDKLDAALEQKGLNRETVRYRVKTELLLTKMYGGEVTVSEKEISDYVTVNKAVLQAADPEGQKAEAEQNIRSQKLFTIVSQKFQELKDAAKVTKF